MKIPVVCSAMVAVLFWAGCAGEQAERQDEQSEQAKLAAEAKISRADAQKTALSRVPGGVVKESEIEKEHGRLVWSFDIATPGSKDITEIEVDAQTGVVVAVETEPAGKEAKEKD
jgi:uncharacterized membrane protein YkoI